MEETEVPLRSPTDIASQMQAFMEFQSKGQVEKKTISTKHILFIVSGAFTGLTELIRKRLGSKQIGFMGSGRSAEEVQYLLQRVKSVDFIDYGLEAEFIGRLPVVMHCNSLSAEDLFKILKYSEGSLLKQYKRDFQAYDVDVYFTDRGMRAIAEEAATEQIGARGLIAVCERVFREYKYQLPDHEVKEFIVGRKMVRHPAKKLQELLDDPTLYHGKVLEFQLGKVEQEFGGQYGIDLKFTPEAARLITEKAEEMGTDLFTYCSGLFQDYEHGLNLLRKTSSKKQFVIDEDGVRNPEETVERWIKESYH